MGRILSQMLDGLDGLEVTGPLNGEITGLSADSRAIKPGFMFAALPGVKMDGAQFAAATLVAGAGAILTGRNSMLPDCGDVPVVRTDEPRRALALLAARFYGAQPGVAVAVTGTNGKTSVVSFVRQIWQTMGVVAASMGTVGVEAQGLENQLTNKLVHTTPDPVQLQAVMAELACLGVSHVALEASSHGLAQNRLDGMHLAAGAFTNLSRDHLDYHKDYDDYFAAKAGLFSRVLEPGSAAVIASGSEPSERMAAEAAKHGLSVMSVGENGSALNLTHHTREGFGQHLTIVGREGEYQVYLPLVGGFQASNALVAAGLVIAAGGSEHNVIRALEKLQGARGRLDLAAHTPAGAPVFVDYSHTPDALKTALEALRPYVKDRLLVVFGCGGDRDAGKRPQMGQIAIENGDKVYVTDDNPRGENPADIRAQIMAAAIGAIEIGDRGQAIATAVAEMSDGDVLLVAGKGHEEGQIIGDKTVPFSDHEAVQKAVEEVAKNTMGKTVARGQL